jgi:uncharacterized protein (TIGR03086 family)
MVTHNRSALANPAAFYAKGLDSARKFIEGMGDVNMNAPTPCSEWNVRELIQHVLYGTVWIEDIFEGKTVEGVGNKYDGDLIGDNPLSAYDDAVKRAKRAIAGPLAMEQVCHLRGGDVSGADYLTSMFTDTLVHSWDLAKATCQDPALDAEMIAICYDLVKKHEERFRANHAFGEGRVADPGEEAGDQARMLAILGRVADWTA